MPIEEMFTSLPAVSNATMNDIICAVQGYAGSANLGLSVQETLGQVYALFQSNVILYNAGNPNGVVAGTTYQLCWDTTNNILYVCTTSGAASSAVWKKSIMLTAGSGIAITQAGNTITVSSIDGGLAWNNVVTAAVTMVSNNAYVANDASSLVTLTLPVTSAFGDVIYVLGQSSGGWSIAQNAGQKIIIGTGVSTAGASGSVSSTHANDSIMLGCVVANTTWQSIGSPQTNGLTIV
jgi:hypothetical protein